MALFCKLLFCTFFLFFQISLQEKWLFVKPQKNNRGVNVTFKGESKLCDLGFGNDKATATSGNTMTAANVSTSQQCNACYCCGIEAHSRQNFVKIRAYELDGTQINLSEICDRPLAMEHTEISDNVVESKDEEKVHDSFIAESRLNEYETLDLINDGKKIKPANTLNYGGAFSLLSRVADIKKKIVADIKTRGGLSNYGTKLSDIRIFYQLPNKRLTKLLANEKNIMLHQYYLTFLILPNKIMLLTQLLLGSIL